jgi:lipopolysaccharide/colanic/teichoic acid biosynthesis glycosyltransferase
MDSSSCGSSSPGHAYDLAKRAIDVLGAGTALVMLGFPMVFIWAAVRASSPGPGLYRAPRVGRHGQSFTQLKFRSMAHGAPDLRNPDGSTVTGPSDRRVTPLGRWLRRWSLDELPQLINILRGDMSFVGPRPDPLDAVAHYREGDINRLSVLPGLTGWAAVNGRNRVSWERRRDLDLEYVRERSLRLDFRILAMTVALVIRGEGVHGREVST